MDKTEALAALRAAANDALDADLTDEEKSAINDLLDALPDTADEPDGDEPDGKKKSSLADDWAAAGDAAKGAHDAA